MNQIAAQCSWADSQVLFDKLLCNQLGSETVGIIRAAHDARYLDVVARTSLSPKFTDQLFVFYEPLFPELSARWCNWTSAENVQGSIEVLACFASILPAAPCLTIALQEFLVKCKSGYIGRLAESSSLLISSLDVSLLSTLLLALFRLYSYDVASFGNLVSPVQLSSLLRHDNLSVRYLAVRCLALYMMLADEMTQKMICIHVPKAATLIEVNASKVPIRLFCLREEQRWEEIACRLQRAQYERRLSPTTATRPFPLDVFSSQTGNLAGILLPRVGGKEEPSYLVDTPTTTHNLAMLGKALQRGTGILLAGPVSSGKTLLVTAAAKMLHKFHSMTTLHLNEQTDFKSLLGIYTTSPTDGSFFWQPGVLTQAMSEGRWVLIENIHKAPPEVNGALFSIMEHSEVLIPSRNETYHAAPGFCILATTTEIPTRGNGLTRQSRTTYNSRLWSVVDVKPLQPEELKVVLSTLFPKTQPYVDSFLDLHCQVQNLYEHGFKQQACASGRTRTPNLRDLFKWCSRSQSRFEDFGVGQALEAIDEEVLHAIFKDGVHLHAGHLRSREQLAAVAQCVAENMHVSPHRMRYCLFDNLPVLREERRKIRVGRAVCPVNATRQMNGIKRGSHKPESQFALTSESLKAIEEIATSVQYGEPALLVGETGVGKTAVVQHLAALVGQRLTVFNLSQQSESGDFLGGLKPITTRSLVVPLSEVFDTLFDETFSSQKNVHFLASARRCVLRGNWTRLVLLWQEAVTRAQLALQIPTASAVDFQDQPTKKRRLESIKYEALRRRWKEFDESISNLKAAVSRGEKRFAFAFVEGKMVKALRNGEWVLLDEINLATPETLESITGLLSNPREQAPSLLLSETGRIERVEGNSNFRIFATMNPATDTGKRELPLGIRTLLTELFIQPSDTNLEDLSLLISTYLRGLLDSDHTAPHDLAKCYVDVQRLNGEKRLIDGAGQVPHFSTRSLVRTLLFANEMAPKYGLRRALYEGFLMSFVTMLSVTSESTVTALAERHLLGGVRNVRPLGNQSRDTNPEKRSFIVFKQHLIRQGQLTPERQPKYIITPYIERNLVNLARAVSIQRFPILLQGPTSSGKTSMVEHLAKISGNELVRVNNHEHTDLQEYLGFYASGESGRLQYSEGVLVRALRRGHWIVLDELNLAPSDVLEALNRLLDDNRELFIPETQEIVKPHPNFVLLATQNPAGMYGGRKHFSRAFRNRFLEVHFDDIPEDELECILKERSQIAPSFCTRIVSVYKRLSMLRQSSRLFEKRNSFATLRDLFRWASRQADDRNQLAINGYMLLAERVRDPVEKQYVKQVIEEVMKIEINEADIYTHCHDPATEALSNVTLTPATRRLLVLIRAAMQHSEPVLLVGETGSGKTQMCQTVAAIAGQNLHTVNAHSNMETSDLIGAQRPVRSKIEAEQGLRKTLEAFLASAADGAPSKATLEELISTFEAADSSHRESSLVADINACIAQRRSLFEWADGSLVVAMKRGELFLLDEISLAEDAVLERLNSVLEPSRGIFLAEKGTNDSFVRASPGFRFLATMNPGGDYGKRELSSALRNRLTEIWVPPLNEDMDVLPILRARLGGRFLGVAEIMVDFARWFQSSFRTLDKNFTSLRDLLSWTDFLRARRSPDVNFSIVHGAELVFIDSLGANPAALTSISPVDVQQARHSCHCKLTELLRRALSSRFFETPKTTTDNDFVQCGEFSIRCGGATHSEPSLVFEAPTVSKNVLRVLRGLQLPKPVLLEGDPGVGKTALIQAIAQLARRRLTRINLSDQTDLMDLFGSDVPADGETAGNFAWRDGPLLRAMQRGDWVLLDEMNLATQSVLEGLNSCFDHRQQIYVAELDRTFTRHPDFVLFATQNPHHQGGGRKGLPRSFINRFTVVYAEALTEEDLMLICRRKYRKMNGEAITKAIGIVSKCQSLIRNSPLFQTAGGPWEINLRDICRWLDLCVRYDGKVDPAYFYDAILCQRFRTQDQSRAIQNIYRRSSLEKSYLDTFNILSASSYQLGIASILRGPCRPLVHGRNLGLSPRLLPFAQSLIFCVNENWPAILVGETGSGKSTLIRKLASLYGAKLCEFPVTEDIDAVDIVGGFEQYHQSRAVSDSKTSVRQKCLAPLYKGLLTVKDISSFDSLLELYGLCNAANFESSRLETLIVHLASRFPDVAETASELARTMAQQSQRQEARFQWNDGVLVEALIKGYWLILDNANRCNSAVLDRLNALLEPGGQLIISEQHESNGNLRCIRPHENFRVFLTMDPRRGELSRSMRNRAVEIHLNAGEPNSSIPSPLKYPTESAISNFRRLTMLLLSQYEPSVQPVVAAVAVDHLSVYDLFSVPPKELKPLFGHDHEPKISEILHCRNLPTTLVSAIQGFYQQAVASRPMLADSVEYWPLHPECIQSNVLWTGDGGTRAMAGRLSWLLESFRALSRVEKVLSLAQINSAKLQTADMNILEKSIATQRLPRQVQDSLRSIAEIIQSFVSTAHKALDLLLAGYLNRDDWPADEVNGLLAYLYDMTDISKARHIHTGKLPIYLEIGQQVASKLRSSLPDPGQSIQQSMQSIANIGAAVQFRSSQSLSRLWNHWRPMSAANSGQLDALSRLDDLTATLDFWPQRAPLVPEMLKFQTRALAARRAVLEGSGEVESLVQDLSNIALETKSGESNGNIPLTFFATAFEALCQYHDLEVWNGVGLQASNRGQQYCRDALLAGRQTKTLALQAYPHSGPARLARMAAVAGWHNLHTKASVWRGIFAQDLLRQVNKCSKSSICNLNDLTKELVFLSASISNITGSLCQDPVNKIGQGVHRLMVDILLCHQDLLTLEFRRSTFDLPHVSSTLAQTLARWGTQDIFLEHVHGNHPIREVWSLYLLPAFQLQGPQLDCYDPLRIGACLVSFALASLRLWIPDRPIDPALELTVQQSRHRRRKDRLETKLKALKIFDALAFGRRTNLRISKVEEEVSQIGVEPPSSPVYRSSEETWQEIDLHFSNILQGIISKSPEKTLLSLVTGPFQDHRISPSDRFHESEALRHNIEQIVRRLSESPVEYVDLTLPATQLLQILDLGVSMLRWTQECQLPTELSGSFSYAVKATPLLGATPASLIEVMAGNACDNQNADSALLYLQTIDLTALLPWQNSINSRLQSRILAAFESCYADWKERLQSDQAEERQKAKYYEYRDVDVNDGDFGSNEIGTLFPDFAESRKAQWKQEKAKYYDAKRFAVEMADLHEIFFVHQKAKSTPGTSLQKRLQSVTSMLPADVKKPVASAANLLPALFLQIEEQHQVLNGIKSAGVSNIYKASNVREARKFLDLTGRLESRIQSIHQSWPEHAIPSEILKCCGEIGHLSISVPVAQLLSEAENLYGLLNEWHTAASKVYSVSHFINELAALIVSWRRLELHSWSTLLDEEDIKCDQEAKSWWFVVYEALISIPSRLLSDDDDCTNHVKSLVNTLIKFLRASSLGQFLRRMELLRGFECLTQAFVLNKSPLRKVRSALANIIIHYERYEPAVRITLAEGKGMLVQDVQEQIKLASWKDTNVTSLRESARRSHYRLFKIVKKYRNLLAGNIQTFTAAGRARDRIEPSQVVASEQETWEKTPSTAFQIVSVHFESWRDAPRRLREPYGAATAMIDLYKSSQKSLDVGSELHEYVLSLTSEIAELRSQTPPKLDESSRPLLLHLKTRKRRLLGEVIRYLRQIGIRRNLSAQELERQASVESILGNLPDLLEHCTEMTGSGVCQYVSAARHHLHGFLDFIDQARRSKEDHTEDLTSPEISRCLGLLEGLLLVMQNQQSFVKQSLTQLASLCRLSTTINDLQVEGPQGFAVLSHCTRQNQQQTRLAVSSLARILPTACDVLEIQARRGSMDFASVTKGLRSYQTQLNKGASEIASCMGQQFSPSIQNRKNYHMFESWQGVVADLRTDLETWAVEQPDAMYLISQLLPWTDWSSISCSDVISEGNDSLELSDFGNKFLAAIDKIFIGIQSYMEAAQRLPDNMDDGGWFRRAEYGLFASAMSLGMDQFAADFEEILNSISRLKAADFEAALSLFVFLNPIIQQFRNICQHVVERYADLHSETCRMSQLLIKSFNQLASEGFCGPKEASMNGEANEGQLEAGVGLGEGDGNEDISNEITGDEDLTELAQQRPAEQETGGIDNEENAVDMRADDLQGKMDEEGQARNGTDGDQSTRSGVSDDEFDEETGSVGNLDLSRVDEKLWEGLANNKKSLQNDVGAGKPLKDESISQRDQDGDEAEQSDDAMDEADDADRTEDENSLPFAKAEKADSYLVEDDALELPDDMQFDEAPTLKPDVLSDDDGLDEFSDVLGEDKPLDSEETIENIDPTDRSNDEADRASDAAESESHCAVHDIIDEEEHIEEDKREEIDKSQKEEDDYGKITDDVINGESGASGQAATNVTQEMAGNSEKSAARSPPAATQDEKDLTGGSRGGALNNPSVKFGDSTSPVASRQAEVFKKLGDVLEAWHRRQREILQHSDGRKQEDDVDMGQADFEHVENELDTGDSQALGVTTTEQARAIDNNMAVEDPDRQDFDTAPPNITEDRDDVCCLDIQQTQQEFLEGSSAQQVFERDPFVADGSQSTIGERQLNGANAVEESKELDKNPSPVDLATSDHLRLISPSEALRLWSHYSSITHSLSLILTEQLRLILSPTQATKLRGDFRTGKRLNLKRIIPYVASQYRRDKIWMRRSVPSKRNYQITIAVDDSKSMKEGGAHALALETLALLCKSLSMLEVGEFCVVSFGDEEHIRIAHAFGTPFTNESGSNLYQHFSFQQGGTNVRRLIQESIQLFREARSWGSNSASSSTNLWQLQLIISDGICEEHDLIRRLVRQASEERIMIVFVIVDSNGVRGNSILDLTQAVFEPEVGAVGLEDGNGAKPEKAKEQGKMKLKMKKYLDGFPFPYYVVVRQIVDLPEVLATALKGWFSEIVEAE